MTPVIVLVDILYLALFLVASLYNYLSLPGGKYGEMHSSLIWLYCGMRWKKGKSFCWSNWAIYSVGKTPGQRGKMSRLFLRVGRILLASYQSFSTTYTAFGSTSNLIPANSLFRLTSYEILFALRSILSFRKVSIWRVEWFQVRHLMFCSWGRNRCLNSLVDDNRSKLSIGVLWLCWPLRSEKPFQ